MNLLPAALLGVAALINALISIWMLRRTQAGDQIIMKWNYSGQPVWRASRMLAAWFTPSVTALVALPQFIIGALRPVPIATLVVCAITGAFFVLVHGMHMRAAVRALGR